MSYGAWLEIDPEKNGVTIEELARRGALRRLRESFCKMGKGGWKITRYCSHEGGEIVTYKNKRDQTMTIQIMKDYTWKTK